MKKVLANLLALVMLFSLLPLGAVTVDAASTSGKTGDCKWVLNGTKLTISGNGEMGDYYEVAEGECAPWGIEITSVIIEEGVTTVGVGAFYTCLELTQVRLPDSLREIRELAFCGCMSLKELAIPEGVTTIGGGALSVCLSMEHITIPDSVITIGEMAFCMTMLTEITVPNSVTELGSLAFSECYSLGKATIGSGITRLAEGLFYNCESLRRVTITDSVEGIAEDAFSGCPGLDDVYYTGDADQMEKISIGPGNYQITDAAEWYTEIAPQILNQPKTVYAPRSSKASVTVGAIGYNLRYEWWIKNDGRTKYTKSSLTGPTYSVKMDDKSKNRRVLCYVYDGNGNRVQSTTAQLRESISVTSHPKNSYAPMGGKVSVKVGISGDGLRYEWWVKNEGQSKYSKSSITSATYTTTMSNKSKNRRVLCKAYDKYGNMVKSESAQIRESVSITTQPKSVTVAAGKSARVTVKASGDGLRYEWYIKGATATKYTKSSITSDTYSVKMSNASHGRRLLCYVYDKYGNRVQSKTVVIKQK